VIKEGRRFYPVYRSPQTKKQIWDGSYSTREEARKRLTEVLGNIDKGSHREPTKKTLSEFADEWLDGRVSIKGQTYQNYQSYLKCHVKPQIGHLKLTDIQYKTIEKLVTHLCQKEVHRGKRALSANTIGKVITMLKGLFKAAIRHGYIKANPAAEVDLPKVAKANVQPPDKTDVSAILEQAPADQRLFFLLDAMTGLRRGELLALQWRDIDWLSGEVLVERAICKEKAKDGIHKYAYAVGTTKNDKSRRVGLSVKVLQALKHHREMANPASEEAFIFARNGTFIDPEYFSKKIALPLIKKVTGGKVKRFHDLRHFLVSMLIEQGESIKYIQDQVGHASASFTVAVHGHLMPQAKREATAKLEQAIFGQEPRAQTPTEEVQAGSVN
jgi:integrase